MASVSEWNSRVRWAECDAAGIIYHARVFDWFSEGRIVWLKEHQLDYYDHLRPLRIELLVKSATASFHHSLRPGDPIRLTVTADQLSPTRITFHYQVLPLQSPGLVALEGLTEHAFVVDGRAKRLDRAAPDVFAQFAQAL